MLKELSYAVARKLIIYSGEPFMANLVIVRLEVQAVNKSNVKMDNCYQSNIDRRAGGVLQIDADGSVTTVSAP